MSSKTNDTSWLQDHIRLTQWDIQQPYQQYNLAPIHSLPINSNQKFIQLKTIFLNHNEEVKSLMDKKQGLIHGGVREQFMGTLYEMMRDITQTKDVEIQRRYLEDVWEWASGYEFERRDRPGTATTTTSVSGMGVMRGDRKGRPGTAITRPGTGNTITNMRKKILSLKNNELDSIYQHNIQKDFLPQNSTNTNPIIQPSAAPQSVILQPSHPLHTKQMQDIKNQQKDYKYQHRTLYSQINVPSERLKQYPRRKRLDLQFEKPTGGSGFKKEKEERILTEDIFGVKEEEKQQEVKQEMGDENENENYDIGEDDQVDIPEIDMGMGSGDLDQQQEPEQVQQQQLVDKLAPRIKVYKDKHPIPSRSSTVEVPKTRNFKLKNNELKGVIQDIESTKFIQEDWVKAKSRWVNEQARRSEAAKIMRSVSATVEEGFEENVVDLTNIKRRPMSGMGVDGKKGFLLGVERGRNELIVKRAVQKQIGNIRLTSGVPKAEQIKQGVVGLTKPRCLSAYLPSSQNPNHNNHHNTRGTIINPNPTTRKVQFSEILSRGKQMIHNQLNNQLMEMKQRLASYKIPLDIAKLKAGIELEGVEMKMLYEEEGVLPSINGNLLLHNPYFKVGKKKKKKKKKK